jgi:hypothetical protein
MNYNIFLQFLVWHFFDMPKNLLKVWKNFLLFNLNYFSLPLLLRTFFSYWHQHYYSYGKGWQPMRWIEAFVFNNIMSRGIGIIFRSVLIVLGILSEIFVFFAGMLLLLIWIFLPFLLLAGFLFGLYLVV